MPNGQYTAGPEMIRPSADVHASFIKAYEEHDAASEEGTDYYGQLAANLRDPKAFSRSPSRRFARRIASVPTPHA